MPRYAYQCLQCGKKFTLMLDVDQRLNVRCDCGGETRMLFYPVPTQWKGGKPSEKL